ncbi:YaaC family protein [Lentibacillus halophilus]|uniref:YaaC family protein n=1 Tax=Lentibacillus halophilus TaxID=295065 RepID=A0ABP3J1H1_9BACI
MLTNNISQFYTYLQSQQNAQAYLADCYHRKLKMNNASVKSFENCSPFIHYLDHGLRFYQNGKQLEPLLQPLLFFYGMVHLIKANLLSVRPDYPESTAILAHGVSSRKRKKRDYTFMKDEVKIQQNGLFSYFTTHLFAIRTPPFTKIKMNQLFALIPELGPLFRYQAGDKLTAVGKRGARSLQFPSWIIDHYHLTVNTFINRIKPYLPPIKMTQTNHNYINIELYEPLCPSEASPFFTSMTDDQVYFPINRDDCLPISEVMVHYLLLYNLSMLCRYEPEWWGEVLAAKPDADFPFIRSFLEITAEKIPMLLGVTLLTNCDYL